MNSGGMKMVTKEQLLSMIPEELKRYYKPIESCKEKVIQNAIKNYAQDCQREDIVAIYDTTIMGNGKKGFLLARDGLYGFEFNQFKRHTSGVNKLPFENLQKFYCFAQSDMEVEKKEAIGNNLYKAVYSDSKSRVVYFTTVYAPVVVPIIEGVLSLLNCQEPTTKVERKTAKDILEAEEKEQISQPVYAKDDYENAQSEIQRKQEELKAQMESLVRQQEELKRKEEARKAEEEKKRLAEAKKAEADRIAEEKRREEVRLAGETLRAEQLVFKKAEEYYEKEEYEKAFDFWYLLAGRENAWAQTKIAQCYESGTGIKKNYESAVSWYQKAAKHGVEEAEFNVAKYHRANGNKYLAAQMFHVAALRGHVEAARAYARMLKEGDGVHCNLQEAYKWYKVVADMGDVEACNELANLCMKEEFGCNLNEALDWAKKSEEKGSFKGADLRGFIEMQLLEKEYLNRNRN